MKRKNFIIGIYKINNGDINKEINIINCNDSNKEEIRKFCTKLKYFLSNNYTI